MPSGVILPQGAISVQEAGYFKPHWKTYRLVELKTRIDKENCLFVANHAFDCIGAKSFGMHTAFIDRRKRPFGIDRIQTFVELYILCGPKTVKFVENNLEEK